MTIIFPKELVKDIKDGGYEKESEGKEPIVDPDEPGGETPGGDEPQPDTPVVEVVTDYEQLTNLPQINRVELKGNKSLYELGLSPLSIDQMLDVFSALK